MKMKKLIIPITVVTAMAVLSCDVLESAANDILTTDGSGSTSTPALTEQEVASGLREALSVGITNAVDLTSVTDGFLGNAEIRLPFPEDAMKVREKALEWGLDGQVEKFETTLNRAAETASKEALPIFKNAITSMSIQDAFGILNGGDGAATTYLKNKTTNDLVTAFRPKVDEAISQVKLTEVWEPIMNKYNTAMTFTGGEKVNPDLGDYVTRRAITGLFHMVEKEENKIRKDPIARVTDLLQKVFGSVTGN